MSNYTREIVKQYLGDQNLAAQYLGFARKLLGELADCTGDIDTVHRSVMTTGGALVTVGFQAGISKVVIDVRGASRHALEGLMVLRCNGPHVYAYYNESLYGALHRGGPFYAADQPSTYWPNAPVGDGYDFRSDYYDDLVKTKVTTRLLTLLTGPLTPPGVHDPFYGFADFGIIDGLPYVLPATPVVRSIKGALMQTAVIGIEAGVNRTNASSCTGTYKNSTDNHARKGDGTNPEKLPKRWGREWRLDEWRLRGGHCYHTSDGFSGYIKPVEPGLYGVIGHNLAESVRTIRLSDLSVRFMTSQVTEVSLYYWDNYTVEIPVLEPATATRTYSWSELEPLFRGYTDVSGHTLPVGYVDSARQDLMTGLLYGVDQTYGNKFKYASDSAHLRDNHWFFAHDDAFYYWTRQMADVMWGFHKDWVSFQYVALPSVCATDGVRPTVVYSGAGEVYTCVCDLIAASGFSCVGLAVGSPFVGWREMPLPTGELLFAKPAYATADRATFFGIVKTTVNLVTTVTVQILQYDMVKEKGTWRVVGAVPVEDSNVSMWDLAVYGDAPVASSMRAMLFNNVAFEQTILNTEYCSIRQFTPWPEIIVASYP